MVNVNLTGIKLTTGQYVPIAPGDSATFSNGAILSGTGIQGLAGGTGLTGNAGIQGTTGLGGIPTGNTSTLGSDFSTSSTSYTDVGVSVSYTLPRTETILIFAVLRVVGLLGTTAGVLVIDESSNVISEGVLATIGGTEHQVTLMGVQSVTSGSSKTWRVQVITDGVGSASVYATGGTGYGASKICYFTSS